MDQPQFDKSEKELAESRLRVYWLAGGLSGFLVGILATAMDYGLHKWESYLDEMDGRWAWFGGHRTFSDVLPALCFFGVVLGVVFAVFLRLATYLYPPARNPACGAALYAFGCGCMWLLLVPGAINPEWLGPERVQLALGHLAGTLVAGAAYGLLLALLVIPLKRR
jgi:hypothetical protein